MNDRNSESAGEYWTLGLRGGFSQAWGGLALSQFVRVDNLIDRDYIGAVSVNETNGRFYAPAAGRTYLIGLTASYAF